MQLLLNNTVTGVKEELKTLYNISCICEIPHCYHRGEENMEVGER